MLLLLAAILAAVIPVEAQQFAIARVGGADAPANAHELLFDRVGRLWVGSTDGLYSFDGSRFFHARFPAESVLCLSEDSQGAIWAGSLDGVHRLSGGVLERVVPGSAMSVLEIAPGTVLAAVGLERPGVPDRAIFHLIRRRADRWEVQKLESLFSVGWVSVDRAGNLMFPNREGWSELPIRDLIANPAEAHKRVRRYGIEPGGIQPLRLLRDSSRVCRR